MLHEYDIISLTHTQTKSWTTETLVLDLFICVNDSGYFSLDTE